MIYVNQKQLDQVEYLIEQSTKGHHVLFENEVIRQVFIRLNRATKKKTKSQGAEEMDESIEKHLENLILQPTLVSKRAYLENLQPEIFDQVVSTYFSIVENNIFESQGDVH